MITDDWKTIVDWKFIRALDDKPRHQKKLLDQQAAIMELIATEAQYIQKLNLIINVSCLLSYMLNHTTSSHTLML